MVYYTSPGDGAKKQNQKIVTETLSNQQCFSFYTSDIVLGPKVHIYNYHIPI